MALIKVTGEDILAITSLGQRTHSTHLKGDATKENKLAGQPYWLFRYEGVVFTSNNGSFAKDLEMSNIAEVRLEPQFKEGSTTEVEFYQYDCHLSATRIYNQALVQGKLTRVKAIDFTTETALIDSFDMNALVNASM